MKMEGMKISVALRKNCPDHLNQKVTYCVANDCMAWVSFDMVSGICGKYKPHFLKQYLKEKMGE